MEKTTDIIPLRRPKSVDDLLTAILPEDPALLKATIAALQAENAQMSATIHAMTN